MKITTPALNAQRVSESVLTLEGASIRLLTRGSGPPLLYLHGSGDLGSWMPALEIFSQRNRVYRPDHPGFNGSDDLDLTSVGEVAAYYARVLDELDLGRITLVGCSLGGWIATELALLQPHRIDRLILIDPAGMPSAEEAPRLFDIDPVTAAGMTFHGVAARAAAEARASALADAAPEVEAWRLRNASTSAHIAGDPYMHDPSLPARVAELAGAFPIDIVWGEFDVIVPRSHARSWTDALPTARLHVVPDTGHLPHIENSAAFFEILEQGD